MLPGKCRSSGSTVWGKGFDVASGISRKKKSFGGFTQSWSSPGKKKGAQREVLSGGP